MAKKKPMIDAEMLFKKWRKDPAYMDAYTALEPEYALHEAMLRARIEAGLTQKDIAERMGTSEAAVSRLFRPLPGHAPSWSTIMKFAKAVGKKPVLTFVASNEMQPR